MATASTGLLGMVVLAATWCTAHAGDFLSQRDSVTKEFVEQTLLEELATARDSLRIAEIQRELKPMYDTLPKNEQGQLEPSTVRYALHRYFVQKHSWHVKGFSPSVASSTNSSSAAIVAELAPTFIQTLLEKQLHHSGMQLQDLAVFASTLSDLIYNEGVRNLHAVYEVLNLEGGSELGLADFNRALRGYLALTVVGMGVELEEARNLGPLEIEAREVYQEYDDLLVWVEDTRLTRKFNERHQRNPFRQRAGVSPEEADALMHDLYHKFGALQNFECAAQQQKLVQLEYTGTGRVSLANFYGDTENALRESVDYLRNQGSLDESNVNRISVVIPNYMSSPSRCMPFSSFFLVCCPDNCESVMARIEEVVAEPSAEPKRIAEIVSNLPSTTQDAPRNLSTTLLNRLDAIAARHQGRVPLHGRLFMQWLHHAYPHDCPYPHEAGTVNPVSQDEWILQNGHLDTVLATDSEMEHHATHHEHDPAALAPLPWTDVEELVAVHKTDAKPQRSSMRLFVMVVAVLSFALPLVRGSALLLGRQAEKGSVHMV